MLEFLVNSELRGNIQDWLVVIACGSALIWGGFPERGVALTWLIVFELASVIATSVFGHNNQLVTIDTINAAKDVIAGLLFVSIALFANRMYTLWIAGLQLLAVFGHLSRGLSELMSPIAYAVMQTVPGWLQLFMLGFGVLFHIRRKRKFGKYRDWRLPYPQSGIGQNPAASSFRTVADLVGSDKSSWRNELK